MFWAKRALALIFRRNNDMGKKGSFRIHTHGQVKMAVNKNGMKQPQCINCGMHGAFYLLYGTDCTNPLPLEPETVGSHQVTHRTGRRHRRRCDECGIHGQSRTLQAYDCAAIRRLREIAPNDVELGRYLRSRDLPQESATVGQSPTAESIPEQHRVQRVRMANRYWFVRSGVWATCIQTQARISSQRSLLYFQRNMVY